MPMESAHELFLHELQSAYDGERREVRALKSMEKKVANPQLKPLITEYRRAAEEHVSRLEQVFEAIEEKPQAQESGSVKGVIQDFTSLVRDERPVQEIVDLHAADTALSLALDGAQEYESLMQLAERSGVMHTTPKVGDLLQPTMKEDRKFARKLKKISDKLIEEVRPA